MNVISDASAVRSRIVIAKNIELFSFSHDNFLNEGKQVIRVDIRFISQKIALMCAARVEIPQRNDSPILMNF